MKKDWNIMEFIDIVHASVYDYSRQEFEARKK